MPSATPGGVSLDASRCSVNGVRWDEAPGLYGQPAPTAQVYATRRHDDGTTVIQFGDGRPGATVPTGTGNVTATYRMGAGVAGRVARRHADVGTRPPARAERRVEPARRTGGARPRGDARTRASNAPTTVRTFGRAVSLLDFADLVRASGEVAKAQAIWLWDGLDRAVHLTVAGQSAGMFADADLRRLGAALARRASPATACCSANFARFCVLLSATIEVDRHYVRADVLAAVAAAAARRAGLRRDRARRAGAPQRHVPRHPGRRRRRLASDIDELQPKRPADRDRPNVDRLPRRHAGAAAAARADPARPPRPGAPRARCCPPSWRAIEDPTRDARPERRREGATDDGDALTRPALRAAAGGLPRA